MAEEQKDKTSRPKRRLRVNTETVRERTEKIQLQAAKPQKESFIRAFLTGFAWPLRWFGRQIGKLGRFRIFRWIGYVLLPPYVRNSWKELRLVSWPDRKQTFRLTYAVIVFSLAFGLIVAGVDWVLNRVFKEIIIK